MSHYEIDRPVLTKHQRSHFLVDSYYKMVVSMMFIFMEDTYDIIQLS